MNFGTKSSRFIKKGFDSELVYHDKYLKTKIKSRGGKINTNFHDDNGPKEGSQYICLLVILIVSVFRMGKNYYPQVFLEECKYIVKEKKIPEYIIKSIEISSDKYDKEDSDEENSNEQNSDEENHIIMYFCNFFLMKNSFPLINAQKSLICMHYVLCKLLPLLKYTLIYTFNYALNYAVSSLGYSYKSRCLLTLDTWHGLEKNYQGTRKILMTLEQFSLD